LPNRCPLPLARTCRYWPAPASRARPPERKKQAYRFAAFLADEDAQHDAAHAQNGQDGTHDVHVPGSGGGFRGSYRPKASYVG
jgi:hypothetical protein